MTDDPERTPRPVGDDVAGTWDDALCRFEDVLLEAPFDEVLPDLSDLLERASVPLSFIEHDERARKLLGEAMLARPAADGDVVRRARVRVELLTLEVGVLSDRIRDPSTSAAEVREALHRIRQVRDQLERLRDQE